MDGGRSRIASPLERAIADVLVPFRQPACRHGFPTASWTDKADPVPRRLDAFLMCPHPVFTPFLPDGAYTLPLTVSIPGGDAMELWCLAGVLVFFGLSFGMVWLFERL